MSEDPVFAALAWLEVELTLLEAGLGRLDAGQEATADRPEQVREKRQRQLAILERLESELDGISLTLRGSGT